MHFYTDSKVNWAFLYFFPMADVSVEVSFFHSYKNLSNISSWCLPYFHHTHYHKDVIQRFGTDCVIETIVIFYY